MNPKIDHMLLRIEDRLEYLSFRYNGDNDTTFEGNYPVVTYADEFLLNCISSQNQVIRMLVDEIDKLKRE